MLAEKGLQLNSYFAAGASAFFSSAGFVAPSSFFAAFFLPVEVFVPFFFIGFADFSPSFFSILSPAGASAAAAGLSVLAVSAKRGEVIRRVPRESANPVEKMTLPKFFILYLL